MNLVYLKRSNAENERELGGGGVVWLIAQLMEGWFSRVRGSVEMMIDEHDEGSLEVVGVLLCGGYASC